MKKKIRRGVKRTVRPAAKKKSTWRRVVNPFIAWTSIAVVAAFSLVAIKPDWFIQDYSGTVAGVTKGFDEFGYNRTARIFNGTGESWSTQKGLPADYLGIYAKDKLVMKWNDEWDRGNQEYWANPPYAAWENNKWNGKVTGGSSAVWHYKIVWVGDYTANPSLIPDGAYGVWGQFATIMDQGTDPSYGPGHLWFAHATPSGYGAY